MIRTRTSVWLQALLGAALILCSIETTGRLSSVSTQAQDLCSGANVNPIACENSKAGTAASVWDISGVREQPDSGLRH